MLLHHSLKKYAGSGFIRGTYTVIFALAKPTHTALTPGANSGGGGGTGRKSFPFLSQPLFYVKITTFTIGCPPAFEFPDPPPT